MQTKSTADSSHWKWASGWRFFSESRRSCPVHSPRVEATLPSPEGSPTRPARSSPALDRGYGPRQELLPVPTRESLNFQFRGEFFNIFNHPQFSDPNLTYCAPGATCALGSIRSTIGTATGNVGTTADSRIIQLALKMNF